MLYFIQTYDALFVVTKILCYSETEHVKNDRSSFCTVLWIIGDTTVHWFIGQLI